MFFENPTTATRSKMDYLDVKNLAQTGEGVFLEFKRTIPSALKIAREIAAFANTHGGTLLIGVDDDKSLIGVDGYQEEEFLLNKAANKLCEPQVKVNLELVQFGTRDLLVITIPVAKKKPVFVLANREPAVFMREDDRSKSVSKERIKVLEYKYSNQGVNFKYGPNEQKLFRYLNEYGEISVKKFTDLIDVKRQKAANILVNLVNAKILRLFTKDKIDYFTYARQYES